MAAPTFDLNVGWLVFADRTPDDGDRLQSLRCRHSGGHGEGQQWVGLRRSRP